MLVDHKVRKIWVEVVAEEFSSRPGHWRRAQQTGDMHQGYLG